MPWTVIVNPAAGRGRTHKLLGELQAAAASTGAEFVVSPEPGAPRRLALEAAEVGRDLVACGGDGLVTEVAGVAADTGRRLAVVPTGSGNDFARVLGYDTKHPLDAFRALEHGRDDVVDLGQVNGRWYTCVTASGFDAEANRWANTQTRLSGTSLYVAAILRTLAVYKPHPFRVTVDGTAHELSAWLVAVGNGPSYGGGMHVTPGADLHDGLLDVTVVGEMSRAEFFVNVPKVFKGTHVTHHKVRTWRAEHVTVESCAPTSVAGSANAGATASGMECYADGERVGPLPPRMQAVSNALNVRVP